MRVPWVQLGSLAVLLMLCFPATGVLGEGGVDPRVSEGTYHAEMPGPVVEFRNETLEVDTNGSISVNLSYVGGSFNTDVVVTLELYGYALLGTEASWSELANPKPRFIIEDLGGDGTSTASVYSRTVDPSAQRPHMRVGVRVPWDEEMVKVPRGYYRVSVLLEWDSKTARSMGHFGVDDWKEALESVRQGGEPEGADFLVSEAGFSVVPDHFKYVSQPNKVPDFSNFSTPVVRPGETGSYGFLVTNRYDRPMGDVTVTIEFYMWATIEDSKPIEEIDGPPPKVKGEGGPAVTLELGDMEVGASVPVDIVITTSGDTDKGTYFVRHHIEFGYADTRFNMSSRGFFTFEQWEGFDYSNLYYQLGVAGIVPDSSFSVKDPVPLWPLATLIVLCVLFGVLAVVFYLAEEHGDQYPRLKRGLQVLTGRWEERRRLLHQRVEELRGEDREGGPDEVDGEREDGEGDAGS